MDNPELPDPTMPLTTGATRSLAPGDRGVRGSNPPAAAARLDTLGRYRIVRVLGEGGMGTVYLARQERPDRDVALKVVRPGYATERMLKRFEMEAEVLGRLLHPGIAQIYEAGTADAGMGPQPFFAMELVKGVPLTRYADEKKLSTHERLELLARVCDAVQHAHQKGVIHRDLKPGNILVTDEGQPKVLDFGVARAIDSDIQQTTMQTDVGAIVGTIPYMSPEQVGGDPAELDTRSDVYALGVIAYELLAGRLPYDLQRKMIHEAARIIKEEEPTRLSSINRTLRGDIETIVAHALEKDKARRYGAASALAADIRRYLSDEPIAARPASTWYQLAKFSRRNTALVGGVMATFFVLVAGIVTTAIALKRESEQRLLAELNGQRANEQKLRAEREAERTRNAEAEERKRADELKQVADFQESMLAQVDPSEAGRSLALDLSSKYDAALARLPVSDDDKRSLIGNFRESLGRVNAIDVARNLIDVSVLRPAVAAIDARFKDQPLIDARLRQALADRYDDLGLYDAAAPLQARALEIRRRELGSDHRDTLLSISHSGILFRHMSRPADAEPLYREALERRRRALGDDDPDTITSIGNMAYFLKGVGRYADALPLAREHLDRSRRVLGPDHPLTLTALNNLGGLLLNTGPITEAEAILRESYEARKRVLGEDDPATLRARGGIGNVLELQGRFAEAEAVHREVLEQCRRVYGDDHPETLDQINFIGVQILHQGKAAEAEPFFREALSGRRRLLGREHADTLTAQSNLANVLMQQGHFAEAEPLFRDALEVCRRTLGDRHPDTITSIANLGWVLRMDGRYSESEGLLREALALSREVLGPDNPDTLTSAFNLGQLLGEMGRADEADSLSKIALEGRLRVLGEDHPSTIMSLNDSGVRLAVRGRYEEAEAALHRAIEAGRRSLGPDHPSTRSATGNLVGVLIRAGKLAEAEPLANELVERNRASLGAEHADTLTAMNSLAFLLEKQGKLEEAERINRQTLDARRRLLGAEHPATLASMGNLGNLLVALGRLDDAEPLLRAALDGRRRVLGEDHFDTLSSVTHLSGLLVRQRRFAESEALLLPAAARADAAFPPGHVARHAITSNILNLYRRWDQEEPGKGFDVRAVEWKAKLDALSAPPAPASPQSDRSGSG